METFSALLAVCAGNSPVPGGFPAQRPVARSFDVFLDLCLNKRLSKQSWGWWFETPACPLWRHCNSLLLCKRYFQNRDGKCCILVEVSLKFVHKGPNLFTSCRHYFTLCIGTEQGYWLTRTQSVINVRYKTDQLKTGELKLLIRLQTSCWKATGSTRFISIEYKGNSIFLFECIYLLLDCA